MVLLRKERALGPRGAPLGGPSRSARGPLGAPTGGDGPVGSTSRAGGAEAEKRDRWSCDIVSWIGESGVSPQKMSDVGPTDLRERGGEAGVAQSCWFDVGVGEDLSVVSGISLFISSGKCGGEGGPLDEALIKRSLSGGFENGKGLRTSLRVLSRGPPQALLKMERKEDLLCLV